MRRLATATYPVDFRTQASWLHTIQRFLEQTWLLDGDVAEFGCWEGSLSLKIAWLIKNHGIDKTVYALDFFEGFQWDDPYPESYLKAGAFKPRFDAYNFLCMKAGCYPIIPIKGDINETIHSLSDVVFSFVWVDLDYEAETTVALEFLSGRMSKGGVVGIDDYRRPETPGIKPAVDNAVKMGGWSVLLEDVGYSQIFLSRVDI